MGREDAAIAVQIWWVLIIVAVAMTCSVALRSPDMMSGSAHGNSTLRTTSLPVMPMPRAASRTAGSTFCTPA